MKQGRIDYRMRRRAVLTDLAQGRRGRGDTCDAHRELLRAGVHIGTPRNEPCPVCDDPASLRGVTYVFTGRAAKGKGEGGRAIPQERLAAEVERAGDLKAYLVEVCTACRWHHLLESYWLLRSDRRAG